MHRARALRHLLRGFPSRRRALTPPHITLSPDDVDAPIAYGVVTAAMLLALEPLLDLGPEARNGLWTGAVVVLLLGSVAAWYLRRALARERP